MGYVGWVADGQPYVTPTSIWRQGDRVYWHGSAASRMIRASDGQPVCVTVAHVDGLVMARSGTNHSVNYRSVMVFGTAHLVTDPAEAEAALEAMFEHLYPGRWSTLRPMTAKELKATAVMWVDLDEASAKIRADLNHDDEGDETWPAWGGVIPVRTVLGEPEPDPFTPDGMPAPIGSAHRGLTRGLGSADRGAAVAYRFSTSQSRSSTAATPITGRAPAGRAVLNASTVPDTAAPIASSAPPTSPPMPSPTARPRPSIRRPR